MTQEKNAAPATRQDIQNLDDKMDAKFESVRCELIGKIDRIAADQVTMRAAMATKEDIGALRGDFASMYRVALEAVEKGNKYFKKAISHADQLQSHEARLQDHEKRIGALESSRPV